MKLFSTLLLLFLFACSNRMSEQEAKEYIERKKKAEFTVMNWIKEHAYYPESYLPQSFSNYTESHTENSGSPEPYTENYVIHHTHQILDKDSILQTFSGYFMIEYDYTVSMIEKERSNSISAGSELNLGIWMEQFGGLDQKRDSIEKQHQYEMKEKKFINEIKSGYERGVLETENPEDLEYLVRLVDSLEKSKYQNK